MIIYRSNTNSLYCFDTDKQISVVMYFRLKFPVTAAFPLPLRYVSNIFKFKRETYLFEQQQQHQQKKTEEERKKKKMPSDPCFKSKIITATTTKFDNCDRYLYLTLGATTY